MKIIFLDIDGVLNSYSHTISYIVFRITTFLHLEKLWVKINDFRDPFDVRTFRVFLLWIIIKSTGAKIVLSSSWRGGWYLPYEKCGSRMKKLKLLFEFFEIEVVGRTPRADSGKRGEEIKQFLKETELDIDRFVIVDDESFDIKDYFNDDVFVKTSSKKQIRPFVNKSCGMKLHHVVKIIKILNKKGN